jgi:GNAT superfamily N-acetyltransferase
MMTENIKSLDYNNLPELPSQYIIRPLERTDLGSITLLMQEWFHDPITGESDVHEVLEHMQNSLDHTNERVYFVAADGDEIVATIGLRYPAERTEQFISKTIPNPNPTELIAMYAKSSHHKKGVGRSLVEKLKSYARDQNFTEILIKSSPRYKDTAWGFYDKMGYTRIGTIESTHDVGEYAQIWTKALDT